MKVLIVEDHPIIINTLSKIFLDIYPDALIKSSTNTEDAVKDLQSNTFDLIISDLDFDGEKRFTVAELAKKHQIKCIIYSGHYNKAFIKKAMELDVIGFVSKLGNIYDLQYALKNYQTLRNYICKFCESQNHQTNNNEILHPDITGIEEHILDLLLIQKPRKEIAKGLDITAGSLNTYINRMTAKNNCKLVGLIHRYIVWKKNK
jgi:DNA-binding NarL/FixJ family response regulator